MRPLSEHRIDPISISTISPNDLYNYANSLGQVAVRADLGGERFNPPVADRGFGRAAVLDNVEAEVYQQGAETSRCRESHGQGEHGRGGGWSRSWGGEEAHFGGLFEGGKR